MANIFIMKAAIGKLAFQNAVEGFHDDLLRALANFSMPALVAEARGAYEVPRFTAEA
jgi:hypothetical protein